MAIEFFGGGFFSGDFFTSPPPPPVVVDDSGAAGGWPKRRKKKTQLRIKFSDFESREKYAAALAAAAMPIARVEAKAPMIEPPSTQIIGVEEDDDDLIIKAVLMKLLH